MSGWWAAAFVVQWILLAALAVVMVALARQVGVLHLRLAPVGALEVDDEGPPIGSTPEPRLASPQDGDRMVLGGPGEPRLVCFVSATCPICDALQPSLPAAARAGGLRAQLISDREAERAYGVPGVPFLVVLDELGIVRSKGTVNTLEQIDGLIDTARRRMAEAPERRAS